MITQGEINDLSRRLLAHAEEVRGNDEIINGLIAHLIRNIDANLTQLWFYGNALKKRAGREEIGE